MRPNWSAFNDQVTVNRLSVATGRLAVVSRCPALAATAMPVPGLHAPEMFKRSERRCIDSRTTCMNA